MSTPQEIFVAVTRFGLGAKPGDFTSIRDSRQWLSAQLDPRHVQSPALDDLPSTMQSLTTLHDALQNKKEAKEAARNTADEKQKEQFAQRVKDVNRERSQEFVSQIAAITRASVSSNAPFFERLVQFWRNHFTVSVSKRQNISLVAAFERDAIRPHVLGSFHDMLRAATRHPAMLVYLDNARSIGPHSKAGARRGKGLNENLAREILELHTLGVSGGYAQRDVTEFAKILTGWTVDAQGRGDGSGFFFAPALHEPGPKALLGYTFREAGEAEGEEALKIFARHPSTARFIATKLARHFVSDNPPESAIVKLQSVFIENNGELLPLYRALIDMEETWATPLTKVKTPNDYILSMLCATGIAGNIEDRRLVGAFRMLGQVPFSAPSPAGWSDSAADWIGAEALLQRIDLARFFARSVHTSTDPNVLLESTIGPVASSATRQAVKTAGAREEAIALLFASPEFQRR